MEIQARFGDFTKSGPPREKLRKKITNRTGL
jgi:hypothetical protein